MWEAQSREHSRTKTKRAVLPVPQPALVSPWLRVGDSDDFQEWVQGAGNPQLQQVRGAVVCCGEHYSPDQREVLRPGAGLFHELLFRDDIIVFHTEEGYCL